jgi:hypothetical protein
LGIGVIRALLFAAGVIVAVSLLPVENIQPSAFASPSFARYYARSAPQQQQLLWGGGPLVSLVEPFTGAPGNRRLVQYFDRGRMELGSSDASSADGSVTQGLLVREMATGYVQLGYDSFVQGDPAPVDIFGGPRANAGSAPSLTYADFTAAATTRAPDRTRSGDNHFAEWIAPGGVVSDAPAPAEVVAVRYESETGHNIPDVTAGWLETDPFGVDPLETLGFPISEPFWTPSGMGELGVSLVQLFERRVVVYTPDLPEAERFSLTNAGRHYYRWRYGNDPTPGAGQEHAESGRVIAADDADLTVPEGYHASVLMHNASDVVDIAVAPDGRLALAWADGNLALIDPARPDDDAAALVQHLANPVELTWSGTNLYVVDDAGLQRYLDIDADGVADAGEELIDAGFERGSLALAAGPDGSLYLSGRQLQPAAGGTPAPDGQRLVQVRGTRVDVITTSSANTSPVTALVADDGGALWSVTTDNRLVRFDPATGASDALLEAGSLGGAINDLLLYRPDGTTGDPYGDMLALVGSDGGDGRIVRLQPAHPDDGTPGASPVAKTSAIADFISGFDRPVAMASGLDGSLYVLDAGRGVIYWIQPD